MSLVFELCDLRGNVLTEFGQRTDVNVTVGLPQAIGPSTAQLSVSMDDEGSSLVKALETRLRAYLDGQPIFYGPVGTPRRRYGDGLLDIVAADPGVQLQASFVEVPLVWPLPPEEVDPDTGEVIVPPEWIVYGLGFPATDQGQIMRGLVDHARPTTEVVVAFGVPDHGVGIGSIPASRVRDRFYEPGKQIWQAMIELANVRGGPDFELRPVLGQGATCCVLDVHPEGQGEDRSDEVVFVYGADEENCRNMVDEPQGFATRNRFTVLGQAEPGTAPPFWIQNHRPSQALRGIWEGFEGRPDVSEGPTTKEQAEETVSALAVPPPQLTVTPAVEPGVGQDEQLGVPPRFGPRANVEAAYWIGDTVRAIAVRGGHRTDLTGRVVSAQITEQPNGSVQVAPTLGGLPVAGGTAA